MSKTAGDATAASSVNRNAAAESAHFDVVRGEIELARRTSAESRASSSSRRSSSILRPTHWIRWPQLCCPLGSSRKPQSGTKRSSRGTNAGNESQDQTLNAHVRLAEISARLGRPDRARELCNALLAQWKGGDDDLVLLKDARKVLAGLK